MTARLSDDELREIEERCEAWEFTSWEVNMLAPNVRRAVAEVRALREMPERLPEDDALVRLMFEVLALPLADTVRLAFLAAVREVRHLRAENERVASDYEAVRDLLTDAADDLDAYGTEWTASLARDLRALLDPATEETNDDG